MNFEAVVSQCQSASAEEYLNSVDEALTVLSTSPSLVQLDPIGEAIVVGDLHGDLTSLTKIMKQSRFLELAQASKPVTIIFLGDYIDRGSESSTVYLAVLLLKMAFPKQVVLLRGNHEGPADLQASPHDLPMFLQQRFSSKWQRVYQKIHTSFESLSMAAYVEGRYLMVHGGLPAKLSSLAEIANARALHPAQRVLEELLWNDPDDAVTGAKASPRGAGFLFGKDVTNEVLARLDVQLLIRGHEPASSGYKISHDGKVLTLFSRKGSPYFNRFGAFLQMPLASAFEDACQLVPFIHRF
jgi:protein phosphatase